MITAEEPGFSIGLDEGWHVNVAEEVLEELVAAARSALAWIIETRSATVQDRRNH